MTTPTTPDIWAGTSGPRTARIALVGESWGAEEANLRLPFVGASENELTRILKDAGIDRRDCFITNLVSAKPPANELHHWFGAPAGTDADLWGLAPNEKVRAGIAALQAQLAAVNPAVVVAFGNYALWALGGHTKRKKLSAGLGGATTPTGITNWRGSMLRTRPEFGGLPLLPTLHPAVILRQWEARPYVVHDLRARIPKALHGEWDTPPRTAFHLTTLAEVRGFFALELSLLAKAPQWRVVDIETRRRNITCIGIATSASAAVCLPLVRKETADDIRSFWSREDELEILGLLRSYLLHPNLQLIGQNFLYDMQYLSRWLALPTIQCHFDTMLAQHLLFPGTSKDLATLASLYCSHYVFWKEESQEWDGAGTLEQLLSYNCLDTMHTFEIFEVLQGLLAKRSLATIYETYTLPLQATLFRMMQRGLRVSSAARSEMRLALLNAAGEREAFLLDLIPQSLIETKSKVLWPHSGHQQRWLLFDWLGLRGTRNRKTGAETANEEAINELKLRYPLLVKILDTLLELRSIGVLTSNTLAAGLDPDGRMRCSFNPGGTETFRLSSSANAFYRGTNLQNVTKGG